MRFIWFKTVRFYVKLGLRSYFKDTYVFGKENIPKGTAILFVGNHRNGLIDPIMVATTSSRVHLFLTRASAFKNPIANFLLRSINMIPIYRIRDGVNSMQKNQEIFDTCNTEFETKRSVLMFPEGDHGLLRRVRPLTKGFVRIAFGYFDRYPNAKLQIVPVGLNYSNMQEKGSAVAVYYGKPIAVCDYYNPDNEKAAIESLKNTVFYALKNLTTHIEDVDNHEKVERALINEGIDFLDPKKANTLIEKTTNWNINLKNSKPKQSIWNAILRLLFVINTLAPIIIWNRVKSKPKDIVLIPTFRYGLSLALVPLYYILQTIIVALFSSILWGFVYFTGSILLLILYKNSIYTDKLTTKPS